MKYIVALMAFIIMCICGILLIHCQTDRDVETRIDAQDESIAALEKALADHAAALEKHEDEFHFYWKRDKTK